MASDDVDYSSLISNQLEQVSAQSQEPKPSKGGIKARKNIAERASEKPDGVDIPSIVNTAKTINQQIGAPQIPEQVSNTMNLVAGGTGVLAGLLAIYGAVQHKKAKEALEALAAAQDDKPDLRKDLFKTAAQDPLEVTPEKTPLQQLKERVLAGREAGIGGPSPEGSVAPSPIQRQPLPQTAGAPPFAVSSPKAPVPPVQVPVQVAPDAPNVAEAIAEGQPGSKVADTVVREELNKVSNVEGRVRRTKAQIEAQLAEKLASAPEGMLPSAPKKTNKLFPTDVIGQGGWHWFEGQGGTPEEWLRQYGRTNQPYQRVLTDVKGGVLGVPPAPEGAKGGTVPRKEYVPEYIKGNASFAQLGSLAANALGAAGLLQAYKQGKETGDYSDFGLGAIGQILGNIAPKTSVGFSLMAPSETQKGHNEELAKRRKMKPTID